MDRKRPFHVMVKPIGPVCNLNCHYCFYLTKQELFPETKDFRLSDELLQRFVADYIQSQPGPEVSFAWQGGEPTLMGLDFFRRVVELQTKYLPAGWKATNALQTNGTLLNRDWAHFLKEQDFLVGLSLDGTQENHDLYRQDQQKQPTWERVVEGLQVLLEYEVETNILAVVNKNNGAEPLNTYVELKSLGAEYIQFIPLVEITDGKVGDKSISGPAYGRFLITIFNHWLENDLGSVFIQIFEETLSIMAGLQPGMCVFLPHCGRQVIMEHNGDIYSCDHFVEPKYRLGNIMENSLSELVESGKQQEFGLHKAYLSPDCTTCPVVAIYRGGCPKNRINGLNTLCAGYRQFFLYVHLFLREIAMALKKGYPAAAVQVPLVELLKSTWDVRRNDPCPCGSGFKYKKCCAMIS